MNDEQQVKLESLIAELESFATPELIREACKVVALQSSPDQFRTRMKAAMDAAISAQMVYAYLPTLRNVEDWRVAVGKQILHCKEESRRLLPDHLDVSAKLAVQASHLAGEQDVIRHYWVIAVGRLQRSLEKLAREAGYKLAKNDKDLLETYRDLRDYYEHLEGELPGSKSGKQQSVDDDATDEVRITFGLQFDSNGRIVLGDKRIDVNSRGLQTIEDIVQRIYCGSRTAAIGKVRKHYRKRPDDIPSLESIDSSPIVSVEFPGR